MHRRRPFLKDPDLLITLTRAREVLIYDDQTGEMRWRTDQGKRAAGQPVGSQSSSGHLQTWIDGNLYQVHRLAWLLHYGEWPVLFLDHVDGDRANNKIANLRQANGSQNCANRAPARKMHGSLKGASYCKMSKRWKSSITKDGRARYLGCFKTEREAHDAYCSAAKQLHGDFARFN